MSLRSSPTIVPTLSVTDSASAFPRKNAFRTSLFSPENFQMTPYRKIHDEINSSLDTSHHMLRYDLRKNLSTCFSYLQDHDLALSLML